MLKFHGNLRNIIVFLSPPLRLNTKLCPLYILGLCGYVILQNLLFPNQNLHLSMITTRVLFRLQLILCTMNASNILKWTVIALGMPIILRSSFFPMFPLYNRPHIPSPNFWLASVIIFSLSNWCLWTHHHQFEEDIRGFIHN